MSTASPVHPVETSQQRSATALDKPHADTDITRNGETQKVKEKKLKEQPGLAYPLEVRQFCPFASPTMPDIRDSQSFAAQPKARIL